MTTVFNKRNEIWAAVVLIAVALAAAGCRRTASAAGSPRPPEVQVAPVEQRDVPVYREWIGTLDGMVNAAIRAGLLWTNLMASCKSGGKLAGGDCVQSNWSRLY